MDQNIQLYALIKGNLHEVAIEHVDHANRIAFVTAKYTKPFFRHNASLPCWDADERGSVGLDRLYMWDVDLMKFGPVNTITNGEVFTVVHDNTLAVSEA